MRFRFVCAIAVRLPITSDSTASATSICCQSIARRGRPTARMRIIIANDASFGAAPSSSVTAVGEPWYTSGTHMWNGTAPSLKAMPATTNTRPNTRSVWLAPPLDTSLEIVVMSSEPVAP